MWTWLGSSRAGGRVVASAIVLMALLNVIAYRLPVYANLFWPQDAREMRHISLVSVGIGLAQTLVLWLAYRRLAVFRARRLVVAALCVAIGISAALSFAVPMQSHDAYAYVGYAKVTHFRQAYDPPQTPFTGTFAPISHDWGVPMVPCVYGPLWLALDRGIAGSAQTLDDALVRLRFLNLVLVAAIAGVLIALRVPEAWVWLFAVNPATWNYLVFSAHNDVVAVFLACAAVLATTLGWLPLAALLAACAALCKVTFALAALAPFALLPAVRARVACVVSTVLIAAAGSWFFGGPPYLVAMFDVGNKYGAAPAQHAPAVVLHAALAALAVGAVCVALVRRSWIGSAIWSFLALGAFYTPWYALWGLPYGLSSRRYVAAFLISLPLVDAIVFSPLTRLFSPETIALVVIALAAYQLRPGNGGLRRLAPVGLSGPMPRPGSRRFRRGAAAPR